jgi:hypothetical protein
MKGRGKGREFTLPGNRQYQFIIQKKKDNKINHQNVNKAVFNSITKRVTLL